MLPTSFQMAKLRPQAENRLRKEAQLRHLNPDGAVHSSHAHEPV